MRTAQVALLVLVAFVAASSALQREARAQATLSAQDPSSGASPGAVVPNSPVSGLSAEDKARAEVRIKELEAQGVTRARIMEAYTMQELAAPELHSAKARAFSETLASYLTTINGDVNAFDKTLVKYLPFISADEKDTLLSLPTNLDQGQKIFREVITRRLRNQPVGVATVATDAFSAAPPSL